ncbi:MAG: glycosyltransferase family 4 protein [Acidiferrobacter sp.]
MSLLANAWATRGHTVTLITLTPVIEDFYQLAPTIARIGLGLVKDSFGLREKVCANLVRLRSLRRAAYNTRPDVVISFVDQMNITTLLALAGTGIPVVISERVNPMKHHIAWPWQLLRRLTYPFARGLVVQSPTLVRWARRHARSSRVHVIPNPVMVNTSEPVSVPAGSPLSGRSPFIIAIGRLTHQKGFDHLIRAFASCAARHPQWRLVILGEGAMRPILERLITTEQLSGRVLMPGIQQNTSDWLRKADLFVLSSRFEGFPNALLEAMAAGLAVVSYACESGPADIITDQVNGVLIPPGNIDALTVAIDTLMADEGRRRSLGAQAREVRHRFDIDAILGLWDAVISQVSRRPTAR